MHVLISAHSSYLQIPFEITFQPKELKQDIRYEGIPCDIEGGKPLTLTLTGACIKPNPEKEVSEV